MIDITVEYKHVNIATFSAPSIPRAGDILTIDPPGQPRSNENVYVVSYAMPVWRIVDSHLRTVFITVDKVAEDK